MDRFSMTVTQFAIITRCLDKNNDNADTDEERSSVDGDQAKLRRGEGAGGGCASAGSGDGSCGHTVASEKSEESVSSSGDDGAGSYFEVTSPPALDDTPFG